MDNNEQFKVESYISDSRLAFLVFHFLVKIISGNTLENWDIEIERNRKAAAVQFFMHGGGFLSECDSRFRCCFSYTQCRACGASSGTPIEVVPSRRSTSVSSAMWVGVSGHPFFSQCSISPMQPARAKEMAYCRSCSRSSLGANDRSVCTPFPESSFQCSVKRQCRRSVRSGQNKAVHFPREW